jgi:hypothetical protein
MMTLSFLESGNFEVAQNIANVAQQGGFKVGVKLWLRTDIF